MNFIKLKSEKITLQKMSQTDLMYWFIWLRDARKVRYASIRFAGQATKGMGDVLALEAFSAEGCEKPGVTVKQVMIPGFLNWL